MTDTRRRSRGSHSVFWGKWLTADENSFFKNSLYFTGQRLDSHEERTLLLMYYKNRFVDVGTGRTGTTRCKRTVQISLAVGYGQEL